MKKIHTKNFAICFLLSCIIIIMIIWFILVWHENHITKFAFNKNQLEDPSQFLFSIDNVNYRKDGLPTTRDYIQISGWLVKPDEGIKSVGIHIILKNVDTKQFYLLPTTIVERTDVTSFLFDEYYQYNFDQSGFSVKIPQSNNINTDHYDYEIMALYTLNNKSYIVPFDTSVKTWEEPYYTIMTEDDFQIVRRDDYSCSIDRIRYKNRTGEEKIIQIEGWAVLYGCEPTDYDISVVLQNNITEEFYKIAASKVERPDVKDIYNDSIDYMQSGFSITIRQDDVINFKRNHLKPQYYNDYNIYIMYAKDDINYLLSTGTSIKRWKE